MTETTYTDPLTGSGTLDGTTLGSSSQLWSVKQGTWTRGASACSTTAAASTNPMAVTTLLTSDFDVQVGTSTNGGGDALYFRFSDTSNWWRLRNRYVASTGSYISGYTGSGWTLTSGSWYPDGTQPGAGDFNYVNGVATYRVANTGLGTGAHANDVFVQTFTQQVVPTYSSYATYAYYTVLEKCVAGVIAQVAATQQSSVGTLRVAVVGTSIVPYMGDGTTMDTAVIDDFNDDATGVGVGLGGSDSSGGYSSGLHDFSVSIDTPVIAPTILSPADNDDVDIDDVVVTVQSNFLATDPPTSIDLRFLVGSATDWTETDAAFTHVAGAQWTATIPASSLTAATQTQIQVRATDSQSNTTDWTGSVYVTPCAVPTGPVFVSPASGDAVVVASDIAVVDFTPADDPWTAMQARRVADDGEGNANTAIVYQDSLTITAIATGDNAGDYLLTGDGNIHPTGPEHIQVRRRTHAGGTLWSAWVDLAVVMSLAPPHPPLVAATSHVTPSSAWVQIDAVFPPAGDADHSDADHMDVYRDGVRIASIGITDNQASYTDLLAGTECDYRVIAVAGNGATASWG